MFTCYMMGIGPRGSVVSYLDSTRGDGAEAHAHCIPQHAHGAYEAVQAMLASKVKRIRGRGGVSRDATDGDEGRVAAARTAAASRDHAAPRPVREGQLREAHGRNEVDPQGGESAGLGVGVVARGRGRVGGAARRVPEGGPGGLEDAGAGDNDGERVGEGGGGEGEEGGELGEGGDVCAVEEGARR